MAGRVRVTHVAKDALLVVRMPEALRERLAVVAGERGLDMSKAVRVAIEKWLEVGG